MMAFKSTAVHALLGLSRTIGLGQPMLGPDSIVLSVLFGCTICLQRSCTGMLFAMIAPWWTGLAQGILAIKD